MFGPVIDELIDALRCLPGVGPKSAQRMALHLLERNREGALRLSQAIVTAAEQVRQFAGIAQGVHVMAVRAEERIPEVLERAGLSSQPS